MSARACGLALACLAARSVAASPTGASMLTLPVSVRQAGMGGVALGGRDPGAAWANPALLSRLTGRGEVALGGGSLFGGEQTAVAFAGGFKATDRLAAGALFSTYGASVDETDAEGAATGATLSRRLTAAGAAASWSFGRLAAGLLAKVVNDDVFGDAAATPGVDVGAVADFGRWFAAVSYRNLGPALRAADAFTPDGVALPAELRAGGGLTFPKRGLTLAIEAAAPAGADAAVALGVEWQAVPMFALRAGVADLTDAPGRFSLGLSASPEFMDIDYAFAMHPAGAAHRASVSYAWGRPRRARTRTVVVTDAATPAADRLNLGVQDLAPQGVSASDAAVITDILRSELVKTGAFKVLERSNMEKILTEQGFQQTGCTSAECAIKLGKLLNVQRMVMGSAGKLFSAFIVNIRVVDIQSGEIVYTDEARGKDDRDLTGGLQQLAARLAANSTRP